MSHTQAQHQAAASASPPSMQTTPSQQAETATYRLAVAQQPTIELSVMALLQTFCSVVGEALDKADPASLQAFTDNISQDPKSWCDAVVANTPAAVQSTTMYVGLPGAVQEAFNKYAMQQEQTAASVERGTQGTAGRH